jgi:peptide/nickel transport system permease protein
MDISNGGISNDLNEAKFEEPLAEDHGELRKALRREHFLLTRRKVLGNKKLAVGGFIVFMITFVAIFAPFLATHSPYAIKVSNRLRPPSAEHLFGTDAMGRDVYSRVIFGARISITVGFTVGLLSGALGLVIGLYSTINPILDNIFMRVCDGLKAIPQILLAIALMAVLGADIKNVVISLAVVRTPNMARITRSSALQIKEQAFIDVMRSLGASKTRILWMHIAPNILSPVLVQMTFTFVSAVVSEAALSFLGAGIPPPEPSWGSILSNGKEAIYNAWWLTAWPGLFTAVTVLGLNFVGEGLRDVLDPHNH